MYMNTFNITSHKTWNIMGKILLTYSPNNDSHEFFYWIQLLIDVIKLELVVITFIFNVDIMNCFKQPCIWINYYVFDSSY